MAGVEQSLRRMRTDYLDAVQFHSSPSRSVLEDHQAIDTLHELRDAGKIRFVGMSGTLPELPGQIEMGVFDLMQIPYSALQREHETWITTAAEAGIGTVIRGGVAKGEPGASGVDRAGGWGLFEKAGLGELREEGESSTGFMLRFTLSHPGVDTIIVGTLNADHLADNVSAAARGPLAPDVYEAAKERLVKAGEASA